MGSVFFDLDTRQERFRRGQTYAESGIRMVKERFTHRAIQHGERRPTANPARTIWLDFGAIPDSPARHKKAPNLLPFKLGFHP
jgi:hypothetical protein